MRLDLVFFRFPLSPFSSLFCALSLTTICSIFLVPLVY
jgi:hypothetical protein